MVVISTLRVKLNLLILHRHIWDATRKNNTKKPGLGIDEQSLLLALNIMDTVITLNIWTDRPEQSVDPDQMPHSVASDHSLHCLPLVCQSFRHISR